MGKHLYNIGYVDVGGRSEILMTFYLKIITNITYTTKLEFRLEVKN